ncbi:MAG: hypothetical protein ACFNZW_07500 [Coriobacteriaceae bacterium]
MTASFQGAGTARAASSAQASYASPTTSRSGRRRHPPGVKSATGRAILWQEGACLITQVDRLSGYLASGKAARKARAEVNEATKKALAGEVVLTVTLDRGKEFLEAEGLQQALGAPVCFCPPHHLWERGTNENANGLLRD